MAQIIVINSINNASGKTLIATHLAVALAKNYKVMIMDECSKSKIADFIAMRHVLNMNKNYNLPTPVYKSLNKQNFHERENFDVIILDSPNNTYFQYADIFITPLSSREGLESLTQKNSLYASLIWEAKKQRAHCGKSAFRWIVIPNDIYSQEDYQKLNGNSRFLGFSIAPHLTKRPEFSEGLEKSITVLDKDMPQLKTLFDLPDLYARRNLKKLTDFIWQNK